MARRRGAAVGESLCTAGKPPPSVACRCRRSPATCRYALPPWPLQVLMRRALVAALLLCVLVGAQAADPVL